MTPEQQRYWLPNHVVRNVHEAKLIYSSRGYHAVEFKYQPLLDNTFVKMGIEDPNKIKTSEQVFSRKTNAIQFIKVVNKDIIKIIKNESNNRR